MFAPGDAFQFDWSADWAIIAGKWIKLQLAHSKLFRSRALIVRAHLLQTHETLFDALTQAFRVLGGVPRHRHGRPALVLPKMVDDLPGDGKRLTQLAEGIMPRSYRAW